MMLQGKVHVRMYVCVPYSCIEYHLLFRVALQYSLFGHYAQDEGILTVRESVDKLG